MRYICVILAVLCGALCNTAHPFIITSGPILKDKTATEVVVAWKSDEAGMAHVRYGTSVKTEMRTEAEGPSNRHEVVLADLRPGQEYFYAVYEGDAPRSDVFSFRTGGSTRVRRIAYETRIGIGDAVVLLSGYGAFLAENEALARTVGIAYSAVAPIIHLSHGNGWGALGSLALRTLLPAAGVAIGAGLDNDADCTNFSRCIAVGPVVGGVAGIVGAMAIDINFLAYKKVRAQAAATEQRTFSVRPGVGLSQRGSMTLGLHGRF